jgi:hypothetical protein
VDSNEELEGSLSKGRGLECAERCKIIFSSVKSVRKVFFACLIFSLRGSDYFVADEAPVKARPPRVEYKDTSATRPLSPPRSISTDARFSQLIFYLFVYLLVLLFIIIIIIIIVILFYFFILFFLD